MTARHRMHARLPVPRTPVGVKPLQHFEMTALRRAVARPLVPRTPIGVKPLQQFEVPALRFGGARVRVPCAQPYWRARCMSRSRNSTVGEHGPGF